MFHSFDSAGFKAPAARKHWMALLARAPAPLLESALADHASDEPLWLRMPETGLMMVQGRVGGTGERFNLGEVTVTRCALRMKGSPRDSAVGVAYVLGRSHRKVQLAALADAMLQDPRFQELLELALLTPIRQHLLDELAQRQQRAQSTKVDFFTVARESGAAADPGDEE